MRPDPETDSEGDWVVNGGTGVEPFLLEVLYHACLLFFLYLYWRRWPLVGGFLPLLAWSLWRRTRGLGCFGCSSGRRWSLLLSSDRLVLAREQRLQVITVQSPVWTTPFCIVLICRFVRPPSGRRSCRLVLWRHRIGEVSFRQLRRYLRTLS